jgi:predicted ATPase
MILRQLLERLMGFGVVCVMTSKWVLFTVSWIST